MATFPFFPPHGDIPVFPQSFFAERFFALFDSDGSGSLSREELLGSLRRLLRGNPTEKLRFLFQVYDVDGSGSIDAEELRAVLRGCLRESSLALPEERLRALSHALLQALDRDRSGAVTFPELQEQLEAFPELLENLSVRDQRSLCCFSRESRGDRRSGLCCLGLWVATSALLLAQGALWHRGRGPALALARGCGQSLNLNCALLAALMLRRSLTWLRSTPLAELFPLELHVRGHELVAYLVLALATAHTAGHLAHAGLSRRQWRPALAELLGRPRAGGGGAGDTAPHSGMALLALLLAMLLASRPCVRRGGHFQVFYWSHLSYIPVWFLLLLHGPHFWKWFLIPGSLFLLEKVLGWAWRRAGDLHILEAKLLPSKVTHLVIQRPKSFRFQPGDYVYLNVPAIAAYEWHPFSISSAPEQPGAFFSTPGSVSQPRDPCPSPGIQTLWLHIRARGQWTNRLYEFFQQLELQSPEPDPPGKSRRWEQVGPASRSFGAMIPAAIPGLCSQEGSVASGRDRAVELVSFRASGATFPEKDPEQGGSGDTQRSCRVKCFLDGPYGTPSRRIFTSEHAVLIGAGIGITPFASILQSVMFRYRRRRQSCPSCHFSWSPEQRDEEMTLRKVDFIWITRDQQHLQWFLGLLAKLETEQAELEPGGKFLELHLYMTSALGKGDVKALGLQLALDLLAAQENRDSITGLRTRTQPGRPDWDKVFGKVAAEQRGKVRVFFCGSAALAKVIRGHCRSFGFAFSKENF
ncbi:NADPH oxidase 5 [Sylvia atricapilla]|uniref:NADPH oxidase 5 n=1 Tax=Sylvia atricapilla TaxID=48155 RepID=UPI003396C53A